MQSLLIQKVQVIAPSSPYHKQKVDVLVTKGKIDKIGVSLEADPKTQVIDASGHYLAPGFFDLNVNFGEPGFETKEEVVSGSRAALSGGVTGVAVQPNTQPPLHRHAEVALVKQRAQEALIDVHPLGTVSKGREGKELAELYDMQLAGAVGFTDGDRSMQDAGMMGKALLYAKGIDALIISFPEDKTLNDGAQMNEGEVSTFLGMKGKPNLAESLMVARDLYLAEYHGVRIHFTTISTKESVALIRQAKLSGIKVTADVAVFHLFSIDEDLKGFESNYKTNPPLRTAQDREALLEGLKDGTLDAIVSQHTPHEIEFKNVEFHIAKNGMIGLQTLLPIVVSSGLKPEMIVEKLSINPRNILGLPVPIIEVGAEADFVVFDTKKSFTFDQDKNYSKSNNSPYFGVALKGHIICTVKGKNTLINV